MTPHRTPPRSPRRRTAFFRGRGAWIVFAVLALLVIVLGLLGFARYFQARGEARSFWDLLYLTLQLFPLQSGYLFGPINPLLEAARFLAPALTVFAAVRAFLVIFRNQVRRLQLRFTRGHVVVVGLGRKGTLLARRFRDQGRRVVVIERDRGDPGFGDLRDGGITLLVGDAAHPEVLARAYVHRAAVLLAVAGDDGLNIEVAVQASRLLGGRRGRPLEAFIHIVDPDLCRLIREQELELERFRTIDVDFFNIYDRGARAFLESFPLPAPPSGAHIVIVGFGRFGRSLAVHAARSWRDRPGGAATRLRVTVVDPAARRKIERFTAEYPAAGRICDFETREHAVHEAAFLTGDYVLGPDGRPDAAWIAVCLGDQAAGLQAGLDLAARIRDRAVPIVVRMSAESGLSALLGEPGPGPAVPGGVYAFDLYDRTCRPELVLGGIRETIARGLHDAYLADQRRRGKTVADNPSMVDWDRLPEALKASNRDQAAHIGEKLKAVGARAAALTDWDAADFRFSAEEIDRLGRMEHDRWAADLTARGWRYDPGPKSVERRTHPDLVPWEGLSEPVRDYDRQFIRELPRILAAVDLQIVRVRGGEAAGAARPE